MPNCLGEIEIEDAAKVAAGNWMQFDCFAWDRSRDLDEPEQWAIVYTHNRDSGLLDQSNAAAIEKALEPFTEADDPDVVSESHRHWAVGWIDGFSIRVFRDGKITEAFQKYHELAQAMADYPILDESDYSERETEATFENLADAAWRLRDEYDLPGEWESDVYEWFSEHDYAAIENTDDQGGYPDEEQLRVAFGALEYRAAVA
jgi:hypothetical protein